MGYKGNTICHILKPNGHIARGAAIQTIKRMLWEKFDPEDPAESIPKTDADHFTDLTKPGVPIYEHVKPIPISLSPSRPTPNKKRPIAEDWFIKPAAKSQVPPISLIPQLVSRQASVPPLPSLPPASPPPLPPVLAIQRPQVSYKDF